MACVAAAGVMATTGCGSRTSMLELEGYELGGASFGGSLATGGKATGTAGTLPSAGGPSTPSTDRCAQYCNGYAKTCANELKGDCQGLCQAEIDGFGAKCQVLGISALECLTPFFQPGNGSCDAATKRGLAQCGRAVANFTTCKPSAPTPTPMPDFMDPATCPSRGGVSPGACKMEFGCLQGIYQTSCSLAPDGASAHCYCHHDDTGWMGGVGTTDFSLACVLAASQCPRMGARDP
jgi:hypothetical protein